MNIFEMGISDITPFIDMNNDEIVQPVQPIVEPEEQEENAQYRIFGILDDLQNIALDESIAFSDDEKIALIAHLKIIRHDDSNDVETIINNIKNVLPSVSEQQKEAVLAHLTNFRLEDYQQDVFGRPFMIERIGNNIVSNTVGQIGNIGNKIVSNTVGQIGNIGNTISSSIPIGKRVLSNLLSNSLNEYVGNNNNIAQIVNIGAENKHSVQRDFRKEVEDEFPAIRYPRDFKREVDREFKTPMQPRRFPVLPVSPIVQPISQRYDIDNDDDFKDVDNYDDIDNDDDFKDVDNYDDIPELDQSEKEQLLYFMSTMHLMNEIKEQKEKESQEPLYFNVDSLDEDILPSDSKYIKISTKNQEPLNLSSRASANSTLQEGKHSVLRRDSIDEKERLELEKKELKN
jgi:hypothetical protein